MSGDIIMAFALAACLAVALVAMVRIARVDMATFEIDFAACAVLGLAGISAATISQGGANWFGANWFGTTWFGAIAAIADGLIGGIICAGVAAIIRHIRPARLGRGDIVLLGVIGAVAGTDLIPLVMGLFLAFSVATAAAYSLARGKPLFRSGFPAALPGMAALVPTFGYRYTGVFEDRFAWCRSALNAEPVMITTTIVAIGAITGLAILTMRPRKAGWRRSLR